MIENYDICILFKNFLIMQFNNLTVFSCYWQAGAKISGKIEENYLSHFHRCRRNQFNRILEDNSLEFIDYEYSPKKYASFIIENLMWYRMRRKKTYLIHSLDILLYPVLFIDKYLPKKSKGLDLVCALRKKNRYYDNVIR